MNTKGRIAGTGSRTLFALFSAGLLISGCSDEGCHLGNEVGAFTGDLDGVFTLDLSADEDGEVVAVTMDSDEEGFPLTGEFPATSARPGGCGDLSFEGDLIDAAKKPVGKVEGSLTTTTGSGTWTLDDGTKGGWGMGSSAYLGE